MHVIDHVFILLLFVVQPIHGAFSYRRYLDRIEAGAAADRIGLYRETLTLEWVAFLVLAIAWVVLDRPAAALGFVASSTAQWTGGIAVLLLVCGYLLYAWRSSKRMPADSMVKEAAALGSLRHFLPHTVAEYRHFVAVSCTAGIVEEVLYRGFVFWYLAFFLPLWAVVLVSSVAFGLGHSYQGVSGMLRVTLIGLVFGAFYVLTGSIWLAMLAHTILDIAQGAIILEVLRSDHDQEAQRPADAH